MMKEINLGRVLIENRRKRGITQEELAEYIGVSKAAVSKWEIGMTYPDISLLPRLASYFNISIDELMGYKPQMDTADIRKWYSRLAREFAEGPFEDDVGALPRTGQAILCLRSAPVPHRLPAGQSRNACRYAGEILASLGGGKGHLLPREDRQH